MKQSFRSKISVPPKKKSVCFFGEKKQRPRAPESLQHIQWLLQGIKVPGPTKKGCSSKALEGGDMLVVMAGSRDLQGVTLLSPPGCGFFVGVLQLEKCSHFLWVLPANS